MIVDWILRRYPTAWRERYEEELRDVAASQGITLGLILDLLVGAIDARLHPRLVPSYAGGVLLPANEGAVLSWESCRLACGALLGVLSWLVWSVLGLYALIGIYSLVKTLDSTPLVSLTGSDTAAALSWWVVALIVGPSLGNIVIRRLVRAGWQWQPSRYVALALIPLVMVFWLAQGGDKRSLTPVPDRPCYEINWSGRIVCEYEPID